MGRRSGNYFSRRNRTPQAVEYDELIAEMTSIGKDLNREDVLDCFSENVLRVFIDQQGDSPSASKMFSRLQASADARLEIHELERGMDKKHFVELVTGGYFVAGGVEKLSNSPYIGSVLDYTGEDHGATGAIHPEGRRGLDEKQIGPLTQCIPASANLPLYEFYGCDNDDRAFIFFNDASVSQSMEFYDEKKREFKRASYADESERRLLDFNMKTTTLILKLLDAVVILKPTRLVVSGAGQFYKAIYDAAMKAAPRLEMGSILELIKGEEVEEMVENVDDIPDFWFDDGGGKPYLSTDRRNVWCYERCLSDENRITQKDLYNPGPWPYEEVDYTELKKTNAATCRTEQLETIAESEEEDEW